MHSHPEVEAVPRLEIQQGAEAGIHAGEIKIQVALGEEIARREDVIYRNELIRRYGNVPEWAPDRIRRV